MSDKNQAVHIWNHCHHCNTAPMPGLRYHCESCPDGPDNDLCETCYDLFRKGQVTHPGEDTLAGGLGIEEHLFKAYEGKPLHLFDSWLEVAHPPTSAPMLPANFVVRPIFNAGHDASIGGYAFAALRQGDNRPLIFTALHVMDEMIKKQGIDTSNQNMHYTGKELPAVITEVNLFDVFAANWMMVPLGSAGPMLALPNARTGHEEPYSGHDIAVFHIKPGDAGNLNPVPLAAQKPNVGEPVWLIARHHEEPDKRIFKAVVVESTDRTLVFKFEGSEEKPKYSSGAPILNAAGEVAGINVGGGELKGKKLGHANHVENILNHLDSVA
jgi:hypothetical protein